MTTVIRKIEMAIVPAKICTLSSAAAKLFIFASSECSLERKKHADI
jgi:hypothetical protein